LTFLYSSTEVVADLIAEKWVELWTIGERANCIIQFSKFYNIFPRR
jgi:hypothetical protein